MADGQKDPDGERRAADDDKILSERLRRLDAALHRAQRPDAAESGRRASSASDVQGLARALRLSSEFVAGIVAGGGVGWIFDRLLGTSPWGLIIFFLLGFAAGVLNVLRAAGLSSGAQPPKDRR